MDPHAPFHQVVTVCRGAVSTRLGLESYLRGCPHVGCGTQPHRVSARSRCSPRSCPTSSNIIDTVVMADTIDTQCKVNVSAYILTERDDASVGDDMNPIVLTTVL